jgi:hypothetical protein
MKKAPRGAFQFTQITTSGQLEGLDMIVQRLAWSVTLSDTLL